ncbi:Retrotransposon-derived protein PEG10 [Labeo rohita]|uniref:Retrotransposon-derived protein PEG10 n=1 Tax=Labeo rohita TaxID=84645 RepID=A0ABQ8MF29_LABRO|nr:Retrotransposon-derived protein PEG10 [Labeo rohita]
MDSASAPDLEEFMSLNNARMNQQEERLLATGHAVQTLVAQVSELTSQLQQRRSSAAPPPLPVPPQHANTEHQPEPHLPMPEPYAVPWGTAVWENEHPCCALFQALSEEMRRVFDHAVVGREAARMLADLRQGNKTVSDYSTEFRTLAAECKWNEEAQWDMFLHGLADRIQREIFTLELPADLDGLIDLALRVDAQLQWRDQLGHDTLVSALPARPVTNSTNTVRPAFDQEHMQVESASESEGTMSLLWSCGPFSDELSGKRGKLEKSSSTTLLPVRLQWVAKFHNCLALVDSGAEGYFMDFDLACHLHVPIIPLTHKISVNALNGQTLPDITHTTGQNEPVNLSNVPKQYLDLKEVFSKSSAASLPLHRPYDCAIDLLPGTSPPKGKLYSLSAPEIEAMEKYISDSLAAGFIRPSSVEEWVPATMY